LVKINVNNERVLIEIEGTQSFLALKNRIEIPILEIESVSTENVEPPWIAGRLGTHMPPWFWAGTFWTLDRKKRFYYVRNKDKCITLNLKDQNYDQVIIEVEDKDAIAKEIELVLNDN
jgi:hypothetical protein